MFPSKGTDTVLSGYILRIGALPPLDPNAHSILPRIHTEDKMDSHEKASNILTIHTHDDSHLRDGN